MNRERVMMRQKEAGERLERDVGRLREEVQKIFANSQEYIAKT